MSGNIMATLSGEGITSRQGRVDEAGGKREKLFIQKDRDYQERQVTFTGPRRAAER